MGFRDTIGAKDADEFFWSYIYMVSYWLYERPRRLRELGSMQLLHSFDLIIRWQAKKKINFLPIVKIILQENQANAMILNVFRDIMLKSLQEIWFIYPILILYPDTWETMENYIQTKCESTFDSQYNLYQAYQFWFPWMMFTNP